MTTHFEAIKVNQYLFLMRATGKCAVCRADLHGCALLRPRFLALPGSYAFNTQHYICDWHNNYPDYYEVKKLTINFFKERKHEKEIRK